MHCTCKSVAVCKRSGDSHGSIWSFPSGSPDPYRIGSRCRVPRITAPALRRPNRNKTRTLSALLIINEVIGKSLPSFPIPRPSAPPLHRLCRTLSANRLGNNQRRNKSLAPLPSLSQSLVPTSIPNPRAAVLGKRENARSLLDRLPVEYSGREEE